MQDYAAVVAAVHDKSVPGAGTEITALLPFHA